MIFGLWMMEHYLEYIFDNVVWKIIQKVTQREEENFNGKDWCCSIELLSPVTATEISSLLEKGRAKAKKNILLLPFLMKYEKISWNVMMKRDWESRSETKVKSGFFWVCFRVLALSYTSSTLCGKKKFIDGFADEVFFSTLCQNNRDGHQWHSSGLILNEEEFRYGGKQEGEFAWSLCGNVPAKRIHDGKKKERFSLSIQQDRSWEAKKKESDGWLTMDDRIVNLGMRILKLKNTIHPRALWLSAQQ
ncbi:hypothetical protein Tco_0105011 [Tanacetum coccineum]